MTIFHFNVSSAYVGCDNAGPANCIVTVYGNTWSDAFNTEVTSEIQSWTVPPCPGFVNCTLTKIDLQSGFDGLSGLSIYATVEGRSVIWFMDEVEMVWANGTCAAGLERQKYR
jgi:hypothetical protein